MGKLLTWPEICESEHLNGLWVALDRCRYDQATMEPIEGEVVDADEDLANLCARMREVGRGSCAIRFCQDEAAAQGARSLRPEITTSATR
jgi:hypothetical protein